MANIGTQKNRPHRVGVEADLRRAMRLRGD